MAIEAGRIVTVADFQRLVGTETVRTSSSAGFTTTEAVLDTVTVSLVAGTTYRVTWDLQVSTSTAGGTNNTLTTFERVRTRIRQDNISGTEVQLKDVMLVIGNGTSHPAYVQGVFTAVSTGSKTFVGTGQRLGTGGTITGFGGGTSPVFLRVEVA